ncbi:MAG TPA: cobalamin B12-binding domain-containing protein [Ktedonobacterales bacterium]|nr:cobalamin B12-binding domain-containing protein [Ktedonobacterales bacterium]
MGGDSWDGRGHQGAARTMDTGVFPGVANFPPNLDLLSTTPAHDLGAVTHLLGVRPVVLWQWEQQLKTIAPSLLTTAATTRRIYADRDLGALLWLRDALMSGVSLTGATATLLGAQSPSQPTAQTFAPTGQFQTQPFRSATPSAPMLQGSPPLSRPLGGAVGSGPAGAPSSAGAWSMLRIASAQDLQLVTPLLVRAFGAFDQQGVHRIVQETLSGHTVEDVCLNLFQPALLRIGELWSRGQMTAAGEHFASNYVKGYLFSVFHTMEEQGAAPLILMGCGPHETHELGSLMLAVFWRRAGLRVRYLGADVQEGDLIEEAQARRPALVALSAMTATRVRALTRIAKAINRFPPPRPIFAFGGAVFVRNSKMQQRVPGVYLGDDAATATWHVRRLLDGAAGDAPNGAGYS